jgi:hypothetical protein
MAFIGNTSNPQTYVPQIVYFSGNASTTAFTLPFTPASTAQVLVHVANVAQNPASAYTIIGNTITFTSAPPTGSNNIWIEYASLSTQAVAPSAGTVNTVQLGTISNINSVGSNLTLQTNGTTAITIDQNGRLGMGTSTPVSLITVNNSTFGGAAAVYLSTTTQVTSASAYGGVITVRDAYASGSNNSFAGISFSSSPGNDYAIGKLSNSSGIGYLSIYQSDTPTELLRIDASGNINFKVANAGIVFDNTNSGVLTESTLNDYETGTWTPVYTIQSGSFTAITYTVQSGWYVKVGRMVMVYWDLQVSNVNYGSYGSNQVVITGLPFTAGSAAAGLVNQANNWSSNNPNAVVVNSGATTMQLGNNNFIQNAATIASYMNTGATKNETHGQLTYYASF